MELIKSCVLADLKKEIEAANSVFMATFSDHNATHMAELYTLDCKIMPSGSDVLTGRESKNSEGIDYLYYVVLFSPPYICSYFRF